MKYCLPVNPLFSNLIRPLQRPVLLAAVTAAAGIALSLHVYSRIAQAETARARLIAGSLQRSAQEELDRFADVLESVCALHALSDAVDRAAMQEFIEKGLIHQHAVLGPFGLIQRINPTLRLSLEKQADGGSGYRVVERDADGTWTRAPQRPVHYPLTWQSRPGGLHIPVGFDFASLQPVLQTLQHIERTRDTALAPQPVPFGSAESPRYWVFAPVIPRQVQPNTFYRFGSVIGFAVATFDPAAAAGQIAQRAGAVSRLHLTPIPGRQPAASTLRFENGAWRMERSVQALGVPWRLGARLPEPGPGRRSNAALAAGLAITALLTALLLLLATRTRRIEAEVQTRTRDLHDANRRLQQTLRERERLEARIQDLSAEEQRRIGRDLHDSLGQKLTGAVFLSRTLIDALRRAGDDRQTQARTLNETLKAAVAQVRNMARGLAPVGLGSEGLCEAIEQMAAEISELYAVSCSVTACAAPPALDRAAGEQLYLIAREAAGNAARHADARHIRISLHSEPSRWTLRIDDDGRGPPPDPAAGDGMGIRIMRHRAERIGARFILTAAPGGGTRVDVLGAPNPEN